MRKALTLSLIAMLALVVTFDIAAQKKVDLVWWSYPRFTTAGKDPGVYEQSLVDRYLKENPGVTLKLEMLNYNGGPEKVNVAIATGATPNILIDDPVRLIADYAARGAVVDMEDVLDRATVHAGFLPDVTLGGKVYAYPVSALSYLIGVNKTAFEKANALGKLPLNKPGPQLDLRRVHRRPRGGEGPAGDLPDRAVGGQRAGRHRDPAHPPEPRGQAVHPRPEAHRAQRRGGLPRAWSGC